MTLKNTLGTNVAIPIEVKFGNLLAIQPELAFNQRGYRLKTEALGITTKYKTTINYLELPILVKAGFGGEAYRVNFFGGPSVGFLTAGKIRTKVGDVASTNKIDFSSSSLNRFDFGAVFGTELHKKLGNGSVFLDVRYLLGLADFNSNESTTFHNRGLGVAVGFMHRLSSGE